MFYSRTTLTMSLCIWKWSSHSVVVIVTWAAAFLPSDMNVEKSIHAQFRGLVYGVQYLLTVWSKWSMFLMTCNKMWREQFNLKLDAAVVHHQSEFVGDGAVLLPLGAVDRFWLRISALKVTRTLPETKDCYHAHHYIKIEDCWWHKAVSGI